MTAIDRRKYDVKLAQLRRERDYYKSRNNDKVNTIKWLTMLLLVTTMCISGLLLWLM